MPVEFLKQLSLYLRAQLTLGSRHISCDEFAHQLQVPFVVGDYVTYAGVLASGGVIAAYEIINNVAIYTKVSWIRVLRTALCQTQVVV
jgi:hypothetical protein